MSGILFRIAVGVVVTALILIAGALYISNYYLEEQQRLAAAGDLPGAIEHAQTAARLDPFSPEPLQAEALLLRQQGRNQEAAEALRVATNRDPANYEPYYLLGNVEAQSLNRPELAAETYREALEHNPRATVVIERLAETLLRAGKLEEAKRQYERLREFDRIGLGGLYNLGRIYARTGEPGKGVETLKITKQRAEAGLQSLDGPARAERQSFVGSLELAIADALVVQRRYEEAREVLEGSSSEQAPAILMLIDSGPEYYRGLVLESEIY